MVKILDCTFRDGGYKTGWRFDPIQVRRHIAGSAADVIEIGYRAAYVPGRGEYRHCLEGHLKALRLSKGPRLAVMVNANEWAWSLFEAESQVDIVRVAAHLDAIADTRPMLRHLRRLGYTTTLNIMQAHRAHPAVFDRGYNADVVYVADSFGCMSGGQVARFVEKLRRHNRAVGFHGHNNSGRALSNTLAAMRAGATWLDASAGGIGRGAGNTDLAALQASLGRDSGMNMADLGHEHTLRSRAAYFCGAILKVHPKRIEQWV